MNILLFLAQAATTEASKPPPPWYFRLDQFGLPLIIGVFLLLLLSSSSRSKKAEQRQRDDMLRNMKRGDRVMTVGGILGAVVDVRDNEVVLKVDEGSNTKIKFTRDAIKRVVTEDESASVTK